LLLAAFGSVCAFSLLSCVSAPKPAAETKIITQTPLSESPSAGGPAAESFTARVERDVLFASPSSLREAEELLRTHQALDSEFGRAMLFASRRLWALVYPDEKLAAVTLDPPVMSPVVRALDAVSKGRYADQAVRDASKLSAMLSCLALITSDSDVSRIQARDGLSALQGKAVASVLIPYLLGRDAERSLDFAAARAYYERALSLAADCYPAEIAYASVCSRLGDKATALSRLTSLVSRYPENQAVLRSLAQTYYESGDYEKAEPLIQTVLRSDADNEAFILMRAHILVLNGKLAQAGPLLDAYQNRNPNDPLYLYLRALYLWNAKKSADSALAAIDGALGLYPEDRRLLTLKAEILVTDSGVSPADRKQAEGILNGVLALDPKNEKAYSLLITSALNEGNAARAFRYLESLLAASPNYSNYSFMINVAFAAKQYPRALAWATSWYGASPSLDDAVSAYARALILSGQKKQAMALIQEKLLPAANASSSLRSSLYYCRSQIQADHDSIVSDLRSSLMEDPRNVLALLGMFDVYFADKDYKRAQYYLRQAQSISPMDAEVAVRQKVYGSLAVQ
jgi:cytochrome c-type biogenesis protein CcmH/NrfG